MDKLPQLIDVKEIVKIAKDIAGISSYKGDTKMREKTEVYAKNKSKLADLALIMVALIWGGGIICLKNGLNNMSPLFFMAIRFTLASIFMSVIFYKKWKSVTKKDIKAGMVIGFFIFLSFVAQTYALMYTTVSKQAFLIGTPVIMVPFLMWVLFKKRPQVKVFISGILCCIGVGFLSLNGNLSTFNRGDLLSLICALCIAAIYITIGYYALYSDPIILSVLQTVATAIYFIIAAITWEPLPSSITLSVVLDLFYLIFLATIGAFLMQNVAQKYTPSTHAAIILSLSSVFGAIFAALILKEKMTLSMIVGCFIIFIAILIAELKVSFSKHP